MFLKVGKFNNLGVKINDKYIRQTKARRETGSRRTY